MRAGPRERSSPLVASNPLISSAGSALFGPVRGPCSPPRPTISKEIGFPRSDTCSTRLTQMQHEKLRWGQLFSMPVSPLGSPSGLIFFSPRAPRAPRRTDNSHSIHNSRAARESGFDRSIRSRSSGCSTKSCAGDNSSRCRQPAGSARWADVFSTQISAVHGARRVAADHGRAMTWVGDPTVFRPATEEGSRFAVRGRPACGSIGRSTKLRWGQLFSMPSARRVRPTG